MLAIITKEGNAKSKLGIDKYRRLVYFIYQLINIKVKYIITSRALQ